MRPILSVVTYVALLLILVSCTKSATKQMFVNKEQQVALSEKFNMAIQEESFVWGNTPKFIPIVLTDNEKIRLRVSSEPDRAIHFDPPAGERTIDIGKYLLMNSSIYYGIRDSNDVNSFKSLDQVTKFIKNNTEWYFSTGYLDNLGFNITVLCMLDQDTACFITTYIKNTEELTDRLVEKLISDFSCLEF